MFRIALIAIIFIAFFSSKNEVHAQLKIDAEFRPRFEYRHGYKRLFEEGNDPAAFVSQRSRIKLDLKKEKFNLYISLQDVRVWGDSPQLIVSDESGLGLHQMWAEFYLNSQFSLKVGRQEIILDDHRIFGNVGWLQQARSHDAVNFNWKTKSWNARLFATYNQDGESLSGNEQYLSNTYKTFQALWLNKKLQNLKVSLLFLNNGLQQIDTAREISRTNFSQTSGFHIEYQKNGHQLISKAYYQGGKDAKGRNLDALLVGLEWNKKIVSDRLTYHIGGEWMSGNDKGFPSNGSNHAFNPFYGTNHKFNGFMDYFFAGTHIDRNGLLNPYQSLLYQWNENNSFRIFHHEFWSGGSKIDSKRDYFGTEVDLVYRYKISEEASLTLTYCHFFQEDGIESLHQTNNSNVNNYGFITLRLNPNLLTQK